MTSDTDFVWFFRDISDSPSFPMNAMNIILRLIWRIKNINIEQEYQRDPLITEEKYDYSEEIRYFSAYFRPFFLTESRRNGTQHVVMAFVSLYQAAASSEP